jgi:3-hydroxyisobutyrate dehydrogenase/2-hydroxy-3-oxopropionate reductase
MAKLGFCGLGRMGTPMALRLVDAGHEVAVWNRTPGRAGPLVERGAREAASPAEAADGADALVTVLADPPAVAEVLFGPNGAAGALPAGATLIEMSTIGPFAARETAAGLPNGVGMLDAPVLGSVPQARDGILRVFVGGAEGDFERWAPVLQAMGTPKWMGPLGAGAAAKLVVNSALMVLMTGLAEALALSDRLGVDVSKMLDVLADSPIGVPARGKRPFFESGHYPPNFTVALARKDAGLVVDTADALGLDLPLARAARGWMAAADEAGLGDLDYSAVVAEARGEPAAR